MGNMELNQFDDPVPYVHSDASGLLDENLSWKAKAILIYILNRPLNWEMKVQDLVNRSSDGESSVRAGLRELEEHGYLKRDRKRDDDGIWNAMTWYVTENPNELPLEETPQGSSPPPENPHPDFPDVDNPSVENQAFSTSNGSSSNSSTPKASSSTYAVDDPKPPEDQGMSPEEFRDGLIEGAEEFTPDRFRSKNGSTRSNQGEGDHGN